MHLRGRHRFDVVALDDLRHALGPRQLSLDSFKHFDGLGSGLSLSSPEEAITGSNGRPADWWRCLGYSLAYHGFASTLTIRLFDMSTLQECERKVKRC